MYSVTQIGKAVLIIDLPSVHNPAVPIITSNCKYHKENINMTEVQSTILNSHLIIIQLGDEPKLLFYGDKSQRCRDNSINVLFHQNTLNCLIVYLP